MDTRQIDAIARWLGTNRTRRATLRVLAATTAGAALTRLRPTAADATGGAGVEPANAFGCRSVGQHCRGDDALCCSGHCRGKKPSKGRQDRSRCAAHNVGGCAGGNGCEEPSPSCGTGGVCFRTTGGANFCGKVGDSTPPAMQCRVCRRDADCVKQGFGAGAACLTCVFPCGILGDTGGTACAGPAA
jgi:hypothetical protein